MSQNYTPLNIKSHNSLLTGLPKSKKIVERLKEIGAPAGVLADIGNISGAIDYYKDCKGGPKPILGCSFLVSDQLSTIREKENRALTQLNIIAKNKAGWKNLIKASSDSNSPDKFYHKPRLSLGELSQYSDNLICVTGGLGSTLAAAAFTDYKLAYKAPTISDVSGLLHSDAKQRLVAMVEKLKAIFTSGVFLEVQLFNKEQIPAQAVLSNIIREVAATTKTSLVATASPFYCKREDSYDQRVLLCSSLQTTFPQVEGLLKQGDDSAVGPFFKSDRYFLPSYEEMLSFGHSEQELANTNEIANMVEQYDVLNKPLLPEFPCPNGMSADEYLKDLCRGGWKKKIAGKISKADETTYVERVKYELGVLQGAGLSSYFLILNDLCNFINSNGWLLPIGRGSAAGCLTSYLIDVTQVDPIRYDLLFERFYNAGRNTKDRVSMPDIDLDVPSCERDKIISYIKAKYGEAKVGYISNFQTMKGRGSMKEVLRAYGNVSFEMMNKITEGIPDEASIIDDLQAMKEDGEEPSIILWALKNEPEKFAEWAKINDRGDIEGPLAKRFEQAIRLEGTRKSIGKHASGIVVCSEDIGNIAPLVLDKNHQTCNIGFEMNASESVGLVKFDILGINLLSKVQGVMNILRRGDI